MGASFVARGYAGKTEHLVDLISTAIKHRGLALVDILQPCVSFNKVNTFKWYQERCYVLGEDHDPNNWDMAMDKAREFGERIPLGVIYQQDKPVFEDTFPVLQQGPLCQLQPDKQTFQSIVQTFG